MAACVGGHEGGGRTAAAAAEDEATATVAATAVVASAVCGKIDGRFPMRAVGGALMKGSAADTQGSNPLLEIQKIEMTRKRA